MPCGSLRNRIRAWFRDYVRIQSLVVIFLYAQIGFALIGSLGALYNGVSLVNLAIALFALVAIESHSQSLARIYAVLLFCAVLLDISWFILFFLEIWNISSEKKYRTLYIFSVKLTTAMEIAGFIVRLSSSLLWFQIYRLGACIVDTSLPRHSDPDLRNSFLDPPLLGSRQSSGEQNSFIEPSAIATMRSRADEILGDSIDEAAYHTPYFDDGQNYATSSDKIQAIKRYSDGNIYKGSTSSAAEASRYKSPLSRSLESLDSSLH